MAEKSVTDSLLSTRLNKIFFALVIFLIAVAILEIVHFSAYKKAKINPQESQFSYSKSESSKLLEGLNIPKHPAVSSSFLKEVSTWPYYRNQKTTLINTISGVFLGIEQPSRQNFNAHFIKLDGTPGKDVRGIGLTKEEWDTIKVYDTAENGSQMPIKITDLVPGDYISLNEIFENTSNLTVDSPTSLTIIRTKKAQ